MSSILLSLLRLCAYILGKLNIFLPSSVLQLQIKRCPVLMRITQNRLREPVKPPLRFYLEPLHWWGRFWPLVYRVGKPAWRYWFFTAPWWKCFGSLWILWYFRRLGQFNTRDGDGDGGRLKRLIRQRPWLIGWGPLPGFFNYRTYLVGRKYHRPSREHLVATQSWFFINHEDRRSTMTQAELDVAHFVYETPYDIHFYKLDNS